MPEGRSVEFARRRMGCRRCPAEAGEETADFRMTRVRMNGHLQGDGGGRRLSATLSGRWREEKKTVNFRMTGARMNGNLQGNGDGRTVGGAWRKIEENDVATPLSRNTMEAFARRKGLLTVGHV